MPNPASRPLGATPPPAFRQNPCSQPNPATPPQPRLNPASLPEYPTPPPRLPACISGAGGGVTRHLTKSRQNGATATDLSGLCPGCIANPGTLPPVDPTERF